MKSSLVLAAILLFAVPSLAQNSKGDKPATNPPGPFLRIPKKLFRTKGDDRPNTRDITGRRRIRTKNKSSASKVVYEAPNPYKDRKRKKSGDRPTQARARSFSRPPRQSQHAWNGNLQGGQLRLRSVSAEQARHNVYPQTGPYVNNSSRRPSIHTRPITRTANGKRVKLQSASRPYVVRGKKDVYWGKFSKGEKGITKDLTGRSVRKLNFQSPGIGVGTTDSLKISHRRPSRARANSGKVSGGFVSRSGSRSRPWTTDLSGQKLRLRGARRSESSGTYTMLHRPGTPKRSKKSNQPLPARVPGIGAGGIAQSLRRLTGNRGPKGGGSVRGKRNNGGRPIEVRAPGGGVGISNFKGNFLRGELSPGFSRAGGGFSGRIKTRRPLKGGGSVSGKFNKGSTNPIDVRAPGIGANGLAKFQGNFQRGELTPGFSKGGADFQGNIRARRPLKGGGSVSGKVWNNNRTPINVKTGAAGSGRVATFQGNFKQGELQPGIGKQGYGFAGNIRARRPPHGGGSVTGKYLKLNRGPIPPKLGASGFDQPASFRGNISARKPPHGGGTVTGKFLRFNREPIPPRFGASGFDKPAHFQGTARAKRPPHGGGSISGKIYSHDGKPVDVHPPGSSQAAAAGFSGKNALPWYKRMYIQNPKAFSASLKKQKPKPNTYLAGGLGVKEKEQTYKKKLHSSKDAMLGIAPKPNAYLATGLGVKEKQQSYRKKPHASEKALPGIGPKSGTVKASEYDHAMKMYWSYKHNPKSNANAMMGIMPQKGLKKVAEFQGSTRLSKGIRHNPSSNHNALKVYEPGKAYARINDFSGNLKMKKYNDRQFHPDAQFAHGFRNNVKDERTLLMNFKLFWARWFKKNDTQPGIVKEKERKPRYDKKEKDLWKALYD